jgi:hypothetical protein
LIFSGRPLVLVGEVDQGEDRREEPLPRHPHGREARRAGPRQRVRRREQRRRGLDGEDETFHCRNQTQEAPLPQGLDVARHENPTVPVDNSTVFFVAVGAAK